MNEEVDDPIAEGVEAGPLKVERVGECDNRTAGNYRGGWEPGSKGPPVADRGVLDDGRYVIELKRSVKAVPVRSADRQRQNDRRQEPRFVPAQNRSRHSYLCTEFSGFQTKYRVSVNGFSKFAGSVVVSV